MPRNRFVSPERVRLALSDGDWIETKKRLSYGEELRLQTVGLTGVSADAIFAQQQNGDGPGVPAEARATVDWSLWVVEKLATWLIEWSFRDAEDRPVKLTREAIKALDPETAAEVMAALDAHIEAVAEEKKATPTRSDPGTKSA